MNLEDLTQTSGEWLRGTGPESDIVVSSRVRLARNLAGFPFTNRATAHQRKEIESMLRDRLTQLNGGIVLHYLQVHSLQPIDRQFLVERQLISQEHMRSEGQRGVAIEDQETRSIMVNEEDHVRIQVLRSGFALEEAWGDIDKLDDMLEARISFAYSDEFGYLTACPTNVGTGMRASVMLHLPALVMTKQIEKVFRALQKINLAVRGLYGEGTKASGDFYQISNQVTLGKREEDIVREIREVIPQVFGYERQARQSLIKENRSIMQDRVARAYGTLRSARMMTSEETMDLLSSVRMGINLGLIDDISIPAVNELFIQTQPAHLQKLQGMPLDGEERNVARANFLRQRLTTSGPNQN